MKTKVLNQQDIDRALANDDSSDPTVKFELELTELMSKVCHLGVGEINGYFLAKSIDYIESLEIYDDYDGFTSDSYISFSEDDGEHITYRVTISLQVEN